MVGFGKGDHPASHAAGYLHGVVGALHVAYQHFVKVLYGLDNLFQVFLGIIGIDNHGYALV